jgi:hypothetical protein
VKIAEGRRSSSKLSESRAEKGQRIESRNRSAERTDITRSFDRHSENKRNGKSINILKEKETER